MRCFNTFEEARGCGPESVLAHNTFLSLFLENKTEIYKAAL